MGQAVLLPEPWHLPPAQVTISTCCLVVSAPQQMGTTTTNIAGNITINSGATVSANTGTRNINVKGNWVDNLGALSCRKPAR